VSKLSDIQDILTVVNKVPDAEVMADLDSTVNFAKASGNADITKLAITGFCWGGRIVWLYAAHSGGVKAAVPWYGPLAGQPSELKPKNPVDIAKDLRAPVLGLYAGKDTGITAEHIEKMRAAIKDAGKKAEIQVYPDAQHGFNADYRPSYNATDAKDGWAKMLAFFKENGVG